MNKYAIFEIGCEDPIIYTEDEILKEYWCLWLLIKDSKDSPTRENCIMSWCNTFSAYNVI